MRSTASFLTKPASTPVPVQSTCMPPVHGPLMSYSSKNQTSAYENVTRFKCCRYLETKRQNTSWRQQQARRWFHSFGTDAKDIATNMDKRKMDTVYHLLGYASFEQLVQDCLPQPKPFMAQYASRSYLFRLEPIMYMNDGRVVFEHKSVMSRCCHLSFYRTIYAKHV